MTTKRNRSVGFFLAITVAVLLPLSFYVLAKILGKDKIHLPPYYLPISTSGVQDTVYKQMPELMLVNQMGDSVGLNKSLQGKILLVNFFFTTCNSICPKMTGNMAMLQHAYRKHAKMNSDMDTMLHFISISVDAHDSVARLRQYAKAQGADDNRWWFCTGDKSEIYKYAREQMQVQAAPANSGADELLHSQNFVLLDKERYVRGYYNGLDSQDLKRCADDIGWLGLEKKRK